MSTDYIVEFDEFNRISTRISPSMKLAIQILPEYDRRRQKDIVAFAILSIDTDFGPMIARNIHILHKESHRKPYFVRWPKHSVRGGRPRMGHHDVLDVVGPRTPEARQKFSDVILGLFHFVQKQEKAGLLPKAVPGHDQIEA